MRLPQLWAAFLMPARRETSLHARLLTPTGTARPGLSTRPGTGGKGAYVMAHDNLPEIDGDEILPIEEDTIEEQIDGEHPDGDYPPDIYDDDPDEPLEGEAAIDEDEVTA